MAEKSRKAREAALTKKAEKIHAERRMPGEKPGEGRLQKVEKQQKKERKVPVGQLQRGIKPGDVDVKTGRPKPGRLAGIKRFITRHERPTRPARSMEERAAAIGAVARKSFPVTGTRPGGILDIEALRGETRGPSKPSAPGGAKSAITKARERARTAADLPSIPEKARRAIPAEVGAKFQAGARQGAGKGVEVTRTAKADKETLGGFKATGQPPPKEKEPKVVTKTVTKTRTVREKPKKEPSWWEKGKAALGRAATKVGEVTKEAAQQALKEQERAKKIQGGKAGTKPQAKAIGKAAEKALVPKFEKPKRIKKKEFKGSPPVPPGQEKRHKTAVENLKKRRLKEQQEAVERERKKKK